MKYIFTADWHIRSDKPICRSDNFLDVQEKTLIQIAELAKKENATILVAGDIFDKYKIDPCFEIMLIDIFRDCLLYVVAGNHELLYHRLENLDKSSLGVLVRQSNWNYQNKPHEDDLDQIYGFSFGEEIIKPYLNYVNIALLHKYCVIDNLPIFIENGVTAKYLCDNYGYNIFVTGDNHKAFLYIYKTQKVFNPGCITRQIVDMKDYQPVVYLYDSDLDEYEEIKLLDNNPEVIDNSFIKIKKERDERIEKFINKLNKEKNMDIDFVTNLRRYLKNNFIDLKTKEKIWQITE